MYEFLKSKESIIGEFEILINISDKENTMKYTRDLKVDPSQYFQTKKESQDFSLMKTSSVLGFIFRG